MLTLHFVGKVGKNMGFDLAADLGLNGAILNALIQCYITACCSIKVQNDWIGNHGQAWQPWPSLATMAKLGDHGQV
uniref:SFRICE_020874 n=1 Tax=Spodoptera frugiperda TaxID=7108 RepID=A0A2H1WQ46_SPOFR